MGRQGCGKDSGGFKNSGGIKMSNITVNTIKENIDKDQWRALEKSSTANFFQTEDCYDFYESLPRVFNPFVVSVNEDGVLKGVVVGYVTKVRPIVKQKLTRRAIIIGGPMLADDISQEALRALLENVRSLLRRKAIYIETRNFNDYSKHKSLFESCGFKYQEHLNFKIDTTSEAVVDENMGKSRKRDAKAALRKGAVIDDNPDYEDIRAYYVILKKLYKTRVKTPLFPLSFFKRLYENDSCKFIMVKYEDKVIGGTVCLDFNNKVLYEWFACGADRQYKSLCPSTLATYGGIMYAAKHGYECFDMMGAGKPDEGYGVRDFKSKFGGKLVEHGRFLCVNKKILYFIGKCAVSLIM